MKRDRSNFDIKKFLSSLSNLQRDNLTKLVDISPPSDIRKTVYLSSGGKYSKYEDFLRIFTFKLGYVPIHPLATLGYFESLLSHNNNKSEVVKDCFSLILNCDEMWVFEEELPYFGSNRIKNSKNISDFPEGVLAEIYFWLANKPHSPLRFFTFKDAGIPKYEDDKWSLVPSNEIDGIISKERKPSKFAIIDLGSSTVKLTVCRVEEDGESEVIYKKAITVNIAEGFFAEKILQKNPIKRALEAILDCQKESLTLGVMDVKLIGTGVVRNAKNLKDFIKIVKDETNLSLQVVDGMDAARLIFHAVTSSFPKLSEDVIVVNAGGGTTELVIGNKKRIKHTFTVPLGISELNEKYVVNLPISLKKFTEMENFIKKILANSIKERGKYNTLIYTGGELDYMMITGFPLENLEGSFSHPKKISVKKFKKHSSGMIMMTREQLHSFMPNNPRWMDGAISSNAILDSLTKFFTVKTIIPSNKNLNDGVVLDMLGK